MGCGCLVGGPTIYGVRYVFEILYASSNVAIIYYNCLIDLNLDHPMVIPLPDITIVITTQTLTKWHKYNLVYFYYILINALSNDISIIG